MVEHQYLWFLMVWKTGAFKTQFLSTSFAKQFPCRNTELLFREFFNQSCGLMPFGSELANELKQVFLPELACTFLFLVRSDNRGVRRTLNKEDTDDELPATIFSLFAVFFLICLVLSPVTGIWSSLGCIITFRFICFWWFRIIIAIQSIYLTTS